MLTLHSFAAARAPGFAGAPPSAYSPVDMGLGRVPNHELVPVWEGRRHMNITVPFLTAVLLLSFGIQSSFGQTVSEEARRHRDRGVAAVETAKTPADYEAAISEFEQAARLAPDWPDVYYNLGMVQERAERYRDAISNLRHYLRLVPDASDAEEVGSTINKLEFKAEQIISDQEALDIFASLGDLTKWDRSGEPLRAFGHSFRRVGDTIRFAFGSPHPESGTAQVSGRTLKYESFFDYAPEDGIILSLKVQMEIVSRAKVRGTAVETGFKDGTASTYNFEYVLKEWHDASSSAAKGGSINARDRDGLTLLHFAARDGNRVEAERLIAKGADVNARDGKGWTPLHYAVFNDQGVVFLLIAKGADIDAKDNDGRTALHRAALHGQGEVAAMLIAKGADVNARDNAGKTPLRDAEGNGFKDVVRLLRKHGAKF